MTIIIFVFSTFWSMWLIACSPELSCLDITPVCTRMCKCIEREGGKGGREREGKRWAKHREGQYDVTAASFVAYTLVHYSRMQLTQPSLQLNARITCSATFVAGRNWYANLRRNKHSRAIDLRLLLTILHAVSLVIFLIVSFILYFLASIFFISFY